MAEHNIVPPEPDDPDDPNISTTDLEYVISYQAPLPPPAMLRDYELALPGAAERILGLLEEQAKHRQDLENRNTDAQIAQAGRGQVFAFILALAAIVGSFILLWRGKNVTGTITFITTFAGLVAIFVVGKVKQARATQKNLEALTKLMQSAMRPAEHVSETEAKNEAEDEIEENTKS